VDARNGEHGYGWVSKTLHWLTVVLVLAQFVVGYVMRGEDSGGGHGRGRGHGHGSGHGRGGDDDFSSLALLPVHVTLGVLILAVAITRVAWRVNTPLPPWAPSLTPAERRVATASERTLLCLLFIVPATGLVLVLGDDDLLPLHITAHVAFFLALATHLSLVLGRALRGRPLLLRRML
jgi:cytochrome b561